MTNKGAIMNERAIRSTTLRIRRENFDRRCMLEQNMRRDVVMDELLAIPKADWAESDDDNDYTPISDWMLTAHRVSVW